jgi:hypothetical protein
VKYRISVERASQGDVVSLVVDGQPVEGNIVPLPPEGQTEVTVEVTLT